MKEISKIEFVCDCEEDYRSTCDGLGLFKEANGKQYCVLHYPSSEKFQEFKVALKNKLEKEGANFRGVWFPEFVDFSGHEFNSDISFRGAIFNAGVSFKAAIFNAYTSFRSVTFNSHVNFRGATFNAGVNFRGATFKEDAVFNYAVFRHSVYFSGHERGGFLDQTLNLSFQFSNIKKPQDFSFHTLNLRPSWFINVDPRKFKFVNVEWEYELKDELSRLKSKRVKSHHRLISTAFRQLADNAEQNHRYFEASRFRFDAFETMRIEKFRGFVLWKLDWWYWLASGYGESVGRAFLVFVLLIAFFATGYTRTGFNQVGRDSNQQALTSQSVDMAGTTLGWRQAALYSINISILRSPDPKPQTLAANALVTLETILGPAQAALLALAIRRRFMR